MTGYSSQEVYDQGYHDGLKRALQIVRATDPAGNTRCSTQSFGAAKRRIARVLAGAVRRSEPEVSR